MDPVRFSFLVVMTGTLVGGAGCFFDRSHDCSFNITLECFAAAGGGGSGGGTTTTLPAGCIPFNVSDAVDDDCGVFVSSSKGSDSNDGTKDAPFQTIAKALGGSKGKPVYLCGEVFDEAVEFKAGALIYGALDCSAAWAYAADKRSLVQAPPDVIALRVTSKASVELYDLDVTAIDATVAGGSSIAVLAEAETDVMLERSAVTAGNAADGADGEVLDMPAMGGGDGLSGADACTGAMLFGGGSVKNTCAAEESVSGAGGIGQEASGGAGSPGLPDGAINGGAGEGAAACTAGTAGDPGASGLGGPGASGLGSLGVSGFSGVAGSEGQPGKVGQGGGGGGGAKGGAAGAMMGDKKQCGAVIGAMGAAGASGASGGAGGCGGTGGKGGGAGGASIGVVSLGATITFSEVTITTKAGGKGGHGALGQAGGPGGSGGAGGNVPAAATDLKPGCAGGDGGNGGSGGKGGGGLGGHSIGIAHAGSAPGVEGVAITTGPAGAGGTGEGDMGTGAAGVAAKVQAF